MTLNFVCRWKFCKGADGKPLQKPPERKVFDPSTGTLGMSDLHCTYLDLEEEDFLNPETNESLIQEVLVGESISMLWSTGVGWLEGRSQASTATHSCTASTLQMEMSRRRT